MAENWARDAAIYERILAQMGDGVVTVDLDGRIITFNPAAGALLDVAGEEAIGRSYGELMIADPRFDALNELVLKAIYESEVTHSAEIELGEAAGARNLVAGTTFLRGRGGERIGVIVVLRDVTAERQRQRLTQLFGAYLDPRVVERVVSREAELDDGARQQMTVSFVDLEGFSGLGERLDPSQLVRFLSVFLTLMARPIGESGGVTDKYIGDAVMAFWGPPFTEPEAHAPGACTAALGQRARLPELVSGAARELGPEIALPALNIRCGIATGEMIAGNVGPREARRYTVVGDTVNLASRLESANKELGTRILVSSRTRELAQASHEFRALDAIRVRGRERPEPVYELLAEAGSLEAAQARLRDRFEAALEAYADRDWRTALDGFLACRELSPEDGPSRVMAARARQLLERAPPESWDGTWPPPE
jgi:PAS domain S-box-containing protein